jgi:hypothetical protein
LTSLERCRQILGGTADCLSDDQILTLRDQLAAFAAVAVDLFGAAQRSPKPSNGLLLAALGALDPNERADVEERAAILEFEGKLSRDQAERLALQSIRDRRLRKAS